MTSHKGKREKKTYASIIDNKQTTIKKKTRSLEAYNRVLNINSFLLLKKGVINVFNAKRGSREKSVFFFQNYPRSLELD